MKDKIKNINQVAIRIIRWTIGIFIILLLIILVVIEEKQLSILENEQNISLLKDDRSCKMLASQQLQQVELQARKQKQEITDEMRNNFYSSTYFTCLELSGRDSELFQKIQEEEEESKKIENKEI